MSGRARRGRICSCATIRAASSNPAMPHGAFRPHIDGGGRPRGRAHSGGSRKIEIAGSETRLDCARTGRTRMTQKSGETLSSTVPFSPQSQAPLHMGRSTVEGTVMKSPIVKRSVVINGHKTSISIEDQFWAALKEIAAERKLTVAKPHFGGRSRPGRSQQPFIRAAAVRALAVLSSGRVRHIAEASLNRRRHSSATRLAAAARLSRGWAERSPRPVSKPGTCGGALAAQISFRALRTISN